MKTEFDLPFFISLILNVILLTFIILGLFDFNIYISVIVAIVAVINAGFMCARSMKLNKKNRSL
ncbi:hypothetical protein [Macrococcoides caseolyticum]|uniref:Uncharacterized protein n=1 Tax=Macrococcoides caseolyticum TaxID=69966 RepID=A0A855H1B5_9STAP|nr:hypothetical protein [Macrococcus caseolyticus]PKE05779.1 hypothetical protein CW692_11670 [Macrococcus caseolyticus]PKE16092.1 hypothetical protein CW718_11540 [Macrococcus caseolyticus]PKE18398.1 hypothetical protein CW679_11225 [Macrococcus caseolyticus]PKE20714.1 hypothetical protein CW688_11045 [Macrococcus caseolyticus]PKE22947.1 hypothetical protein CW689_11755 [Macrococcus caseolyticus]